MSRLKVAQINVTYGNADSTGRNVKELHEYFISKGVQSSVYASKINDASKTDDGVHLFSSDEDKKIHAFLSRLTGLQGHFSVASTQRLLQKLDADKPDAVILHVLHSNCINFPMLCDYLGKNDISTVLVLHDCWYFTGHCCHYSQIDCEKWQQDCCHCPQIHEWNKSWFFDTAHRSLLEKQKMFQKIPRLGVVGVSDWITSEAKKSILKEAAVIQRIYNWIDLETFKPRDARKLRKELGVAEDEKVLLGVASAWGNRKGLQEMLMVARTLPKAKVIMIGKMPDNIEIPDNMICVGLVKDPLKLSEYYSMADLFLNPSVQETFGKTTAEALSCGTPAVVYKTTACTELIGENCGKAVDIMTKQAYRDSVEDSMTRCRDFNGCRQFAVQNFSRNELCGQYFKIADQLHCLKVEE